MRVVVQMSRTRKFGEVVGESKDGCYYSVLIDGNTVTAYFVKDKCEELKPGDLGYVRPVGVMTGKRGRIAGRRRE